MSEIFQALSPEMQYAIKELFYRQFNYTDCFNNRLYDLIQKADSGHRYRLSKGFPEFVLAFTMWHDAPDERAFFKTFGLEL